MVKSVFNYFASKAREIVPALALSGAALGFAACSSSTSPNKGGNGGNDNPSMTLTSKLLSNTTTIDVDVAMKNMSSAILDVKYNGVEKSNMTRTVGVGTESYDSLPKGNYIFTASGNGITATTSDSVIEYPTELSPSCRTVNLQQDSTTTDNLESCLSDINVEDTSKIKSFTSLDNKTNVGFSGSIISLTPTQGSTGQYKAQITVSNQKGTGATTDTISGNITALPPPPTPVYPVFAGKIQDNHSNQGELSWLNFYGDTVTDSTWLGKDTTDTNGNFKVKIDSVFPKGTNIIIEATTTKDTARTFAKFAKFPATGASSIIIRPERLTYSPTTYQDYLNNTYTINKQIFRNYMEEMNPDFQIFSDSGIVIAKYNILGTGTIPDSAVTSDTLSLKDPSGGQCDLSEYTSKIKIIVDDGTLSRTARRYALNNGKIVPDRGWGVVYRGTINTTGFNYNIYTALNFVSEIADLRRDVFLHEVDGRGAFSIAPGGSSTLIVYPASLMTAGGGGANIDAYLGPADCDAIDITQDSTYTSGGPGIFTNPYDGVLEISFRKAPANKTSKLINLLN